MPKVMNAETRQPSGFCDGRPWFLQIGARFALVVFVPCGAGKYMRVPMYAGQLVQDREGGRTEINRLFVGFGVWQEEHAALSVEPIPARVQDFSKAGAGKQRRIAAIA